SDVAVCARGKVDDDFSFVRHNIRESCLSSLGKVVSPSNVRVDRAARFHAAIAGTIKLQNTLTPLRSNELCGSNVLMTSSSHVSATSESALYG
ncbi:MAG TPA: hypothetical protein VE961_14425, partial [Pyrinomonadaceae bacterium]|nr:hypothetical protein [Pyrinomonadaceae bacterium]